MRLHQCCPRCGKKSLHIQKHKCASCGWPNAHMRKYNWGYKALRRRTTGVGRCTHLKLVNKQFHAGKLK